VLVVQAGEEPRDALGTWLVRLGLIVRVVGTLAKARVKLNGQDVVFLDLMLPDGEGAALVSEIRKWKRPAKVAVTTALSMGPLLVRTVELRPDALFFKPLNFAQITLWLRQAGIVAGEASPFSAPPASAPPPGAERIRGASLY
jgi:CheY-like chemotaxis protein